MTRTEILFSLALLLPSSALAQDPQQPWRTVETGHFRLHYPVEAEAWSLDAAQRFEAIHAAVTEAVGYEPRQVVDVVVLDPYGRANGFALPSLRWPRMGVFTSAPGADSSIGSYHSWVEDLVVHEDVHLVHLLRPSRSPLRGTAASLLGYGPLALKSPLWMVEGYAVFLEGQLTGSGRPNGDARASLLRVLAREGRLPAYEDLNGNARWMGRAMPYLVGSGFVEWLVDQRGEQSLRDLWARLSARKLRGFPVAFEGVYGEPPDKLYARFCAELAHAALQIDEARPVDQGSLWREMSRSTGLPALSPDGQRLAVVEARKLGSPRILVLPTGDDGEAEREWREQVDKLLERDPQDVPALQPEVFAAEPDARRSHAAHYVGDPRWMPDGQSLLFSAWTEAPDGSRRPDLFVWDVDRGRERRLTRGAGLSDADPAPDGRWAVAVRQRWGAAQLVRVDLNAGGWQALTEPDARVVLDHPRIAPSGDRIAYLRHLGSWELVLRAVDSGHEQVLDLPEGSAVSQPAWRPDGQALYVSLGLAGFQEIWEVPLDGAEPRQLSHSSGAAFGAAPTPDGAALFHLDMDSEGFDLHRLELAQVLPATELGFEPTPPVVRPAPPESTPSLVDRSQRILAAPYGAGRPAARALLGATATPYQSSMDIGLRLGDAIGRWELLAMGGWAEDWGDEGGAAVLVWRRLPVALRLHGFAGGEGPLEPRGGGALELVADRALDWGSMELSLGGWADRPLVGEDSQPRLAGFAGASFDDRGWFGPGFVGLRAAADGQAGADDIERWWLGDGSLGLELGYWPAWIGGSYTLGMGSGQGSQDRYRPAGPASSLLPAAVRAARVTLPVVDPGGVFGGSHEGLRAELAVPGAALFGERHRFWPAGLPYGDDPAAVSLVGLQLGGEAAGDAIARLPGLDLSVGLACMLESPDEGLREKPCAQWSHYGTWLGLAWRP